MTEPDKCDEEAYAGEMVPCWYRGTKLLLLLPAVATVTAVLRDVGFGTLALVTGRGAGGEAACGAAPAGLGDGGGAARWRSAGPVAARSPADAFFSATRVRKPPNLGSPCLPSREMSWLMFASESSVSTGIGLLIAVTSAGRRLVVGVRSPSVLPPPCVMRSAVLSFGALVEAVAEGDCPGTGCTRFTASSQPGERSRFAAGKSARSTESLSERVSGCTDDLSSAGMITLKSQFCVFSHPFLLRCNAAPFL